MNQRFGVADAFSISGHRLTDFDYAKLGHFGWYSDQEADYTGCPGSVRVNDYWTIKRVPLLAKSGPPGADNPAARLCLDHSDWFSDQSVWQIGNRPGWDSYCSMGTNWNANDVNYYLDAYTTCRAQVKEQAANRNCNFKVMTGAVVLGNPQRSNWSFLKRVMQTYYQKTGRPLPVDAFNVQIFIPSTVTDSKAFIRDQITAFREWMSAVPLGGSATGNYRESELWITALGISNSDIDPTLAVDHLRQTVGWLTGSTPGDNVSSTLGMPADDNRLVQCWAWYALNDYRNASHRGSNLFMSDLSISLLGQAYADLIPQANPEPASLLLILSAIGLPWPRRVR